ncbi:hypothetical protein AB2M62_12480 [Sphingomonas sp. MMS12-HWE2-04]|uniref:hypothetical protein n=1 Tax=Sphingomonas sp. MMS12-HWE2-04 TaxID=3234199 RepID=UPI00384D9B66
MPSCHVKVLNHSGRELTTLVMWHTPSLPDPLDVAMNRTIINYPGLPNQQWVEVVVRITHSPTDFWICGVRFADDDANYVLCGRTDLPFKEFEVSDGSSLTFIIPPYEQEDPLAQRWVEMQYSEGDGGMAKLLNVKYAGAMTLIEAILEVV